MHSETHTLPPRAFSEYLMARFRVAPGLALCVALNQPEARNNHEALEAWVADFLKTQPEGTTEQITRQLEQVFSEILMESGLIDGMLESFSFPLNHGQRSQLSSRPEST